MKQLTAIAQAFAAINIQSFFVGGFVRDSILGIASDDIDICLVGVEDKEQVMLILFQFATKVAEEVGAQFPVWIADIEGLGKVDFALARTERLIGSTRKDFTTVTNNVTIEEDLMRRDLTINAIAQNILTGEFIDPFNGIDDLHNRTAREVSSAFAEDTLRVLRAARFCARFDLSPSLSLIELCKTLTPTDISNERVGKELTKLMEQATKPSTFFRFLRLVGWLHHHFQELEALIDVQQDPTHHPEGDAFTHTLLCIDQANDPFTRVVMLCHDLGKATTTAFNETKQKWQALGHEEAGLLPTETLLKRIHWADHKTIKQVQKLVELHMIHSLSDISDKVVRETKRALASVGLTFEHLVEVCRCDASGRHPLPARTPDIRVDFAATVDITPIVTGAMLMSECAMKPSKLMGEVMAKCIEWQDRGSLNITNWKQMVLGFLKDKQ